LEGASALVNLRDRNGSTRSRRHKSNLTGTSSTGVTETSHVKPLQRLTRAASTADPMNDPPS
uniref:Pecanex-like protein n=1 Tax=Echinostoma caproni TaxID=27848 RepID=A0A183A4T9_9TREM